VCHEGPFHGSKSVCTGGMQVGLMVAIDFTSSNGDPSMRDSLHASLVWLCFVAATVTPVSFVAAAAGLVLSLSVSLSLFLSWWCH